jgi:hypothetical protein
MSHLPDGLIVIAKRDCPTCVLVEPLLAGSRWWPSGVVTVYSRTIRLRRRCAGRCSTPRSSTRSARGRDRAHADPREGGREVERTYGWHRGDWQRISGQPTWAPTCRRCARGAAQQDAGTRHRRDARSCASASTGLTARNVTLGDAEDPMEACFARGWTDGLPVVPPTPERVLRMLSGTTPRARRGDGPWCRPTWRPARWRRSRSTR